MRPQVQANAAPLQRDWGSEMKIWTLTVEDPRETCTSVHPTEDAAVTALFDNYDDLGQFSREDLQALMDANGIVVYIQEHDTEQVWA